LWWLVVVKIDFRAKLMRIVINYGSQVRFYGWLKMG
jgi:hypothetical protein